MIPINLVSSTTDSIRQSVVLFKPVPVPTSDPKSEFLYQSSLHCAEPTDPWTTSYAWDISHTLVTTYHPYCHSPSALTKYLKQKLCHQQAKHLSHSLPTQVKQDVPLERNKHWDAIFLHLSFHTLNSLYSPFFLNPKGCTIFHIAPLLSWLCLALKAVPYSKQPHLTPYSKKAASYLYYYNVTLLQERSPDVG